MTALEEIKKAEHERIWLEPAGATVRCWCQDNQWGDEGVEYVLASTLESLQRENEELRQDRDRTARNRDMWKGQVERQADSLSKFREEEIRLRETLFQCGSFIADRYQEGDAEYQVVLLVNDAICSKPALASTGGSNDPRNI
ncbi:MULTISPECIES: hypothetical protein [Rhizobium/Agrobacterium group]|uniref:hypothetical protein n=1 Tax=Rhizobium oryzihabitans TaxID=2267833 RepID=UPI0040338B25